MFWKDCRINFSPGNRNTKVNNNGITGGGQRNGFGNGGGSQTSSQNTASVGTNGGQQGVLRIFDKELAGQISWFIPMALLGIFISSLNIKKKEDKYKTTVFRHILLWGMWILPMYIYFSISSFFHPYYTFMLAPAIAALTGIGLVEMYHVYLDKGWKGYILPAAFVISAILQVIILSRYTTWVKLLIPVVCGASVIIALIITGVRAFGKYEHMKIIKVLVIIEFIVLLIAPAIWAYTPIMYGISNKTLPYTGPELPGSPDVVISQAKDGYSSTIKFLISKMQNEKYLVAVPRAVDAGPIILQTGYPVITVGGFMGTDSTLTLEKLKQMVNDGELRYFELSSTYGDQQSEVTNWVKKNGKIVTIDNSKAASSKTVDNTKNKKSDTRNALTLYDLAPQKN